MIDREDVLHVAGLCRLSLTEAELDQMSRELSQILEHVEKISEIDLSGVEPTSHVVGLQNVLREDIPRPSLSQNEALGQAPDAAQGGFRVPPSGS
jgi:aspartyl-tRNA(Asn)/glutamyl-tRNA(Gln) amidotransferase subunit C